MKAKHKIVRANRQRIAFTNTSPVPDDEIRQAIKFLTNHVDLDGVVVHFKTAGHYRRTYGRAYSYIPRIANLGGLTRWEWEYLIIVTAHPYWFRTLAHEAKHVEQFREDLRRSEVAARAFAMGMLDRWRCRTLPDSA